MYGSTSPSMPQRLTMITFECLMLMFVFWLLFMGGNEKLGLPAGNADRNALLYALCLFTFVRMGYMTIRLLKRGVSWAETAGVVAAFACYFIGFSLLGSARDRPLDGMDALAVAVFVAGSAINSVSEWRRDRWKRDPRNQGRLYTGGLFRYAVLINYFGDVVWVLGFAMLTRNPWSMLVPLLLLLMFVCFNIPGHDRYLRAKYGDAFRQYEQRTKKLIPFIY